jgi:kynurenine formamidase
VGGWFYASSRFASAVDVGTHLDAAIHYAEGRRNNAQSPLSELIGPAVVVYVTANVSPDYLVSIDDFTAWEAVNGPIPEGAILLIRTGWADRWNDRTAYLGTDMTGEAAVAELHFPGISEEAARWIVDNRDIVAVGIDTPSIDRGQSVDFRAHVIFYAENISGFENVANMAALPATGSYVVALPMKIQGGSGGPLRIVAFVPFLL